MTTIVDLLAGGASERSRLHIRPGTGPGRTLAALWDDAGRAATWFGDRAAPGDRVAAVFETSTACISAVIGAWRAGLTVVSLPVRPRHSGPQGYRELLARIARMCEARLMLTGPGATEPAGEQAVPSHPFAATLVGGTGRPRELAGDFVQCSSGTTGRPKGVILTAEALAANVRAIGEAYDTGGGVRSVSWLPLAHDMGFIGLLLTPWAHCTADRPGGEIVLVRPEAFLRAPTVWLRTCAEFGAAVTCAPTFALDAVARRRPAADLDLSALRTVVVGSEPVRAPVLRRFARAMEPAGFDPLALCPGYGLAEASLAVSTVRPGEPWRSVTVDPGDHARGRWSPAATGVELVSSGTPVRDTDVRIGSDGQIEVRSPSLYSGYLGDGPAALTADGFHRTGDIGRLDDGELFVVGRDDDMIVLGGRNLHAAEIEAQLDGVEGARPRCCAVLPDDDGRYVLVVERRAGQRARAGLPALTDALRGAATRAAGVAPSRVVVVAPGSFPLTANGKVQRAQLRTAFADGDLDVCADVTVGRPNRQR